MSKHKISWTDTTWNPLAGCTRASSGCDNCYAAAMALRLEAMAQSDIAAGKNQGAKEKYIGVATRTGNGKAAFNGKINFDHSALDEPYTWKKPRMVFVNSMSDLFHKDVPDAFLDRVFQVMIDNRQHTFQVLTKRAERMAQYVKAYHPHLNAHEHIWLGVSVENQDAADERIPHLLNVPAAVRFLSCEPLLGPVHLTGFNSPLWGRLPANQFIHWVITGGESGTHARPMHPDWARQLRDQCISTGVPFHFKQWGEWLPVAAQYGDDDLSFKLDEASGSRVVCMGNDGAIYSDCDGKKEYWCGYQPPPKEHPWFLSRVGKHKAGRTLDGRTWDEFPTTN